MRKIAIIGSSGAGKTTLAIELGSILNIKVYHLDRLFWQRGWKLKSKDEKIDILQELIREEEWIIEGSYLSSSMLHVQAADTIIFLDVPTSVCLKRIITRHFKYRGRFRRDIPMGSTDRLNLFGIARVLFFRPWEKIDQKLCKYKSKIIELHSAKEVDDFLANERERSKASIIAPVRRQRVLSSALLHYVEEICLLPFNLVFFMLMIGSRISSQHMGRLLQVAKKAE